MSEHDAQRREGTADHDVFVVGGGPAGCPVGVFTPRHGLTPLALDSAAEIVAERVAMMGNP